MNVASGGERSTREGQREIVSTPIDSPPVVKHFRRPVCELNVTPRAPIDTYSIGQRCLGIVRNIAPFGAFIDLGMMDGLFLFEDTEFTAADFEIEQVLTVRVARIEPRKEKLYLEL